MNTASLYELRGKIIKAVIQYEYILKPAARFLLAFALLVLIRSDIGFNAMLSSNLLMVIIALVCALLPINFIAAVLGLVCLGQLYSLSLEAMGAGLVLMLLIFLLYFRFSPRDTLIMLLMPLAFRLNLHYALPVAGGLLCTPGAAAPAAIGIILIGFIETISANASVLSGGEIGAETLTNLRVIIDRLMHNRGMWILAGAFALTVVLVYVIRRLPISYAWTAAMIAGSAAELIILLAGDMAADTGLSIGMVFLGVLLSFAVEFCIQFMMFNVNYTKTESVQFEDDEYYYYVRAVPKVKVPEVTGTIKRFSASSGEQFLKEQFARHFPPKGDKEAPGK